MSTKPEVTVAIPLYQGRRTIRRAVQSIQSQTYRDFEILVIDDGSSDGSAELVESLRVPQLRLLRNEFNKGLGFTRNRLLDEARGKYIAWLDQDDWSCASRLERQTRAFASEKNLVLCGALVRAVQSSRRPSSATCYRYALDDKYLRHWQLFENQFGTSACMISRDVVRKKFLRFMPELAPTEDWMFWNDLAVYGTLINIPFFASYVELSDESFSEVSKRQQRKNWDVVWRVSFKSIGLELTEQNLQCQRALTYGLDAPVSWDQLALIQSWIFELSDKATLMRPDVGESFLRVLNYFSCRFRLRLLKNRHISGLNMNPQAFRCLDGGSLWFEQKSPLAPILWRQKLAGASARA